VDIKSDKDFAKYKEEEKKSLAAVVTSGTIHPDRSTNNKL